MAVNWCRDTERLSHPRPDQTMTTLGHTDTNTDPAPSLKYCEKLRRTFSFDSDASLDWVDKAAAAAACVGLCALLSATTMTRMSWGE